MTLSSQAPIYVIGHLNPDTDAICAAIGQAEFLRASRGVDAEALRCGDIPSRVAWVLEQAGVEAPQLVTDVRTTAELICRKNAPEVSEDETFLSVYRSMKQWDMKSLPVVNSQGQVTGIVRFLDLMQLLMPPRLRDGIGVKTIHTALRNVLDALQGESVGANVPEACHEEDLIIFVGASSEETMEQRLVEGSELGITHKQMVICGDRPVMHRMAVESGVRALVVTGGFVVADEVMKLAREKGVVIILCGTDTATTMQLVRCSRMVKNALSSEFLCVGASEAVADLRTRLSVAPQDLFPVVKDGTRELVGVFTKSDLVNPPRTKLVLVDHNEYSQAVKGVEEADVVEVLDHHRLGGNVVTREAIHFLNEPVGSSSTLVARKFAYRNIKPSRGVALCLCAGLISDTLNLTSPTTTDLDREMLEWLCEIADVQAEKFTHDFFASGSLILKGSVSELIGTDRKEFCEKGRTVSISQVEEMDLEGFENRREEIIGGLENLITNKGYDLALLAVTDIRKHNSLVVAIGDQRLVAELPYEDVQKHVLNAPGVVSRKKQLFPAVCRAIQNAAGTSIEAL